MHRTTLLALAAGTLAAGVTPAALAMPAAEFQSSASGSYYYSLGATSGSLSTSESDITGSLVTVGASKNGYGFDANAESANGQFKAYAATTHNPADASGYGYSYANANASFTDFVSFQGGSGTGVASFLSMLNGTLTGGRSGNAGYSLGVSLYEVDTYEWGYNLGASQALASDNRSIYGRQKVSVNDTFETEFDFEYGKTYAIVANFGVSASDGGIADFSHTASFAMSAAEGTTLVSSAGINYGIAAAVPEPETYAMLLAGLGMLSLIARRRN